MVKKGFSLAEALVVMAVISIFFALATKVVAVKPKNKLQTNPHGYFECYLDGDALKQHSVLEGADSSVLDKTGEGVCNFYPATGVAFFNIHTFGPAYYLGFEPNINKPIRIKVTPSELYMENGSAANESAEGESAEGEGAEGEGAEGEGAEGEGAEDGSNKFVFSTTDVSAAQNARIFLQILYPDSKIYNSGNIRTGVMISW